jgi:prephenate dehydrogenase
VSGAARMIERLALIGVGLIGGSFALALRRANAVGTVIGAGRSSATLEEARRLGIIDEIADSPAAAASGADFILIATPVGQMEAILRALRPQLAAGAVITDGGSTKGELVRAARDALGDRIGHFVPGHPIAGGEKSGAGAARAGLYEGRRVVLTPLPENDPAAVARVEIAWRACGATVARMTPHEHDRVLAAVSHLPHVLAYALVELIVTDPRAELLWAHAAGGFRDFTRIASSHPEMWRDICIANRDALLQEIDRYADQLQHLRDLIMVGDGAALERQFRRSREARDAWLERQASGA